MEQKKDSRLTAIIKKYTSLKKNQNRFYQKL